MEGGIKQTDGGGVAMTRKTITPAAKPKIRVNAVSSWEGHPTAGSTPARRRFAF
jgi:hypothetical protein